MQAQVMLLTVPLLPLKLLVWRATALSTGVSEEGNIPVAMWRVGVSKECVLGVVAAPRAGARAT
jgi:hypothetical protein